MIDFHNHILPNVDDGSRSLEMSLEMLRHAANQGITDVVNTVHYQHPKVEGLDMSFKRINEEIENLQNELDKHSILINIHIGSEVFYYPNLVTILNQQITTIGDGKFMLIEFLPNLIPITQQKTLFDLKMLGVTPIIAHPERYKPVQKDISLVYKWLTAGCLIQVDAGSLLGNFGKSAKVISEKIITRNWCQIIGSDAHDNKKRNFILKDAYKLAKSWIGKDAELLVKENPMAIIKGENISTDLNDLHFDEQSSSLWNKLKSKL
ncbi:MAG: tyrosine-protein phosphatase [Candidatus Neomarinimicrobiota bacterium]